MILAIDFDGTIVEHEFPLVGPAVPGAFDWLRKFQDAGARLILWTMRSDGGVRNDEKRAVLSEAILFCRDNGLEFWAHNENPEQKMWTNSPKVYAHRYIDDAGTGCPLVENPKTGGRPYVDWSIVGPLIMAELTARE